MSNAIYRRTWYAKNQERCASVIRKRQRLLRAGITQGMFDEKLSAQEFKCAVCGCAITQSSHADHDHITNKFRGILCQRCNRSIGLWKDNIDLLMRAVRYLESFHVV